MKTRAQPAVLWAFSPRTSSVGKAGIHRAAARAADGWAPASAGAAFDAVLRSCRPVSDRVGPRSGLVGQWSNIRSRGYAVEFHCQSPADGDEFRCRRTRSDRAQAVDIALFVGSGRAIFGVETRFLPDGREMPEGSALAWQHLGLLRGDAAVDDETGTGHEGGIVRSEKDDALGIGHRLFSRTEMGDGGGDVGGVPEHGRMTDGATMAFSDERLIDAAGAVVADRPEQRPLLVVAVASRIEVSWMRPLPSHGAFCRSRALDRGRLIIVCLHASVPHGG